MEKMKTGLLYWTNGFDQESLQGHSRFSIGWNKYLKEFMIANPPTFKISDKCCNGAKKKPSSEYVKSHDVDLMLVGVRKAEGGNKIIWYCVQWLFFRYISLRMCNVQAIILVFKR